MIPTVLIYAEQRTCIYRRFDTARRPTILTRDTQHTVIFAWKGDTHTHFGTHKQAFLEFGKMRNGHNGKLARLVCCTTEGRRSERRTRRAERARLDLSLKSIREGRVLCLMFIQFLYTT
jgi:hypothetical protein